MTEPEITVPDGDFITPKKRDLKYILMRVPEHLVCKVHVFIGKDAEDFQNETGDYRKWD